MIVVDASVVVSALSEAGPRRVRAKRLMAGEVVAPQHLDLEVLHALARLERRGLLGGDDLAGCVADLDGLPVDRWDIGPLVLRAHSLRHNLTAYDASYVALAELLDVPLATFDDRLSRSPNLPCRVVRP